MPKADQSVLLCRPWRDVGEMGVGGGGPGVSLLSIGVDGSESSSSEEDVVAPSSQLSVTAILEGFGLLVGEIESFLRDESRPWCMSEQRVGVGSGIEIPRALPDRVVISAWNWPFDLIQRIEMFKYITRYMNGKAYDLCVLLEGGMTKQLSM